MSDEEEFTEAEPVEGEDYYMDGPYMVFTEAYHLRRGYCCHSKCRHCPWKDGWNAPSPTQS